MEQWKISYNGKKCLSSLVAADVKQPNPKLTLVFDEIPFFVEFQNRSDYMAARDSNQAVPVVIVSSGRTKRVIGTAVKRIK